MSFSRFAAASVLASVISSVSAHGVATGIVADGTYHQGWSQSFLYESSPPKVVGWSTTYQDNGFVGPEEYGASNIICHKGATPAGISATVAAGGTVEVQWNTWPESHRGPVLDYLAKCSGDCSAVDKTALKFFKIQEGGLDAADKLIANNNTWVINVPSDIAPGNYVLRHEIIAMHASFEQGGAQNYPQCFNLEITGSGTAAPVGISATELYTPTSPGIVFDIYQNKGPYTIPGPALYNAAGGSAPTPSSTAAPSGTPAPTQTSVTTPAPTVPAGEPPFQNSTIPVPTSTKSACKSKSRAPTSVPTPTNNAPVPTVTVIPTPVSPGGEPTASPVTPAPTPVNDEVPDLPEGTKLSSVLKWISAFYAKNGDGEYVVNGAVKRRHARHMRL